MGAPKQTLYDTLGVPRTAKITDINRVYNRQRAEMQKDDAPPDPKRAALLREAFETLSDPDRRAAYDKSLEVRRGTSHRRGAIAFGLVASVAAAVAFYFFQPARTSQQPARALEEILADAAVAVGRVDAIDMSGRAAPVGFAVAIEEGVMVTSCESLPPGAQLLVSLAPRSMPARVATADNEIGLCKLTVEGVGSRPLPLAAEARVGQKVYATKVNSVGQVALTEGKVKNVLPAKKGKKIETSIAIAAGSGGSPLLDAQGRIVGIATAHTDGKGHHVPIPVAWVNEVREAREQPAAPVRPAEEPYKSPERAARIPNSVRDIPPERRDSLEKSFRPPPKVPDDL